MPSDVAEVLLDAIRAATKELSGIATVQERIGCIESLALSYRTVVGQPTVTALQGRDPED